MMKMKRVLATKALLSCFFVVIMAVLAADGASAGVVAANYPAGDIQARWMDDEFSGGVASGYNNGSYITPGELFIQADDFFVPFGQNEESSTAISKLVFYGGTELDAQVDMYTITIFSDAGGQPGAPIFSYSEAPDAQYTTDEVTDLGGQFYRQLHKVTLDTTQLGLTLLNGQTYYLAIQGDVTNTQDTYQGFDTYRQRFYSLRYADMFTSTDFNMMTWSGNAAPTDLTYDFDLAWEVHASPAPEPATCLLLGIGSLAMTVRKRKRQ